VFATEVFIELGLFNVEDGIIRKVEGVKNPLENSKIYSMIRKGKEC
jgi:ssDNA-specific exonuclease RecJ